MTRESCVLRTILTGRRIHLPDPSKRLAIMILRRLALSVLLLAIVPANLLADLPSPQLHRIIPIGINAPGETELSIQGADLEGVDALLFDHPGLKAEFVKDKVFKVTASGEIPAGTYDVRAIGRFGVTNPRLLSITHGLQDVAEVEPNNTPDKAQLVTLNSAVNAQSDGNNQDLFRLPLKQGQRVVIDCQSARLDTEMDPTLVLFGPAGQQLASSSDYYGRDPLIDFIATVDGEYVIEVRDLTYRGGYPYRLVITDRHTSKTCFPVPFRPDRRSNSRSWDVTWGRVHSHHLGKRATCRWRC